MHSAPKMTPHRLRGRRFFQKGGKPQVKGGENCQRYKGQKLPPSGGTFKQWQACLSLHWTYPLPIIISMICSVIVLMWAGPYLCHLLNVTYLGAIEGHSVTPPKLQCPLLQNRIILMRWLLLVHLS